MEQVVIFTPDVALEGDFAVRVKVGIVDTRTGNAGDVPSLRFAWGSEMRMRERGGKVRIAGVEAVTPAP